VVVDVARGHAGTVVGVHVGEVVHFRAFGDGVVEHHAAAVGGHGAQQRGGGGRCGGGGGAVVATTGGEQQQGYERKGLAHGTRLGGALQSNGPRRPLLLRLHDILPELDLVLVVHADPRDVVVERDLAR